MDLFFPILVCCFRLVQSLKGAVVSFIEMVVLDNRDPDKIHFIKDRISGMDSSLENGCIASIKSKAFCF